MDYKTLMEGLSAYPEEMTNAERMAAYANGDEVDHVPYAPFGSFRKRSFA